MPDQPIPYDQLDLAPHLQSGRRVLVATLGLPGSGKTTWARTQVDRWDTGEVVRINRDDLRRMLHGRWTGSQTAEDQVTAIQHVAIPAAWNAGARVVICDDTHLNNPRHLDQLRLPARAHGALVLVADFTAVPLHTCLERNAARPEGQRVPDGEIRRMHANLEHPRRNEWAYWANRPMESDRD